MYGRKFRVMCPDGCIRTATQTREPDVWFAAPARVQAHGLTVSGFVSGYSEAGYEDDPTMPCEALTGERTPWEFGPAMYLKNAHAFDPPAQTCIECTRSWAGTCPLDRAVANPGGMLPGDVARALPRDSSTCGAWTDVPQ